MAPPTLWQSCRQVLGRAFRETGQALDRAAISLASFAVTKHDYYDDPVIYQDHLSRHRHQFPLLWSGKPILHPNVAYVAPCSTLIGSVHVGEGASIWYGAVLRADECLRAEVYRLKETEELNIEPWHLSDDRIRDRIDHHGGGIFVGANSNIQDGCIVTARIHHCVIGKGVTVGHLAQIHSATVGDYSLIGMGAIVMEGAQVETEAFVAAGAVVGSNQVVKSGELWVGNPARKLRDLTEEQREKLHYQSSEYVQVATLQANVMELGGNGLVEDEQVIHRNNEEDNALINEQDQDIHKDDLRQTKRNPLETVAKHATGIR